MGKIPENILNDIQDRCDIVEIISSYIPLRPAGRNFKALCPFHHEKTPSFVVSPDKQIYHCFGCNSGGNVFNFVKEYEKIDFIDAIKMLALKAGVKLPEYRSEASKDDSLVSSIYSINDIATNFYSSALEKLHASSGPRRYIEKRGIKEEVLKKFRIGYADASGRLLFDCLLKRGIKQDVLLKSGLVLTRKDSSIYDLFRNRLVFPVFDVRGRVLGFGARVMDDSLPKYINTPETIVYKKGQHLYGLNFAKPHIKEKNYAIISEGYLDVITSHQHGIDNIVSSLGTALTVDQIRVLKRYTHNVVMIYDADQAGEMATLRGLDLFLEEGMNVKVATLEKGHDPDSYIRQFGSNSFNAAINKSQSLFTYKLEVLQKRFDAREPEAKAEIVKEMLSTISKVKDSVIKAEYIKNLAVELSIKEEAIWDELKGMKKGRVGFLETRYHTPVVKADIKISPAEKILVRLMLEDTGIIARVKDNLQAFDFKNPEIRHLVEALFSIHIEDSEVDATRLINCLEGKVPPNVISFIINEEIEIKDKDRNVVDCIKAIKKEQRCEKMKDIQNRLAIAQKNGYEDETRRLLEEFSRLIKLSNEDLACGKK